MIGFGHETGTETALLDAVRRAAAVQVDFAIAIVLADACGERQFPWIGAAELQGDRLFAGREGQKLVAPAEFDGCRGHHLGVEKRPARDDSVEGAAMPVRPIHHRGDAEAVA